MPDSSSLRDTIAPGLLAAVAKALGVGPGFHMDMAHDALAAIQGYAGRGAAERLEAAHLLLGADIVREGRFFWCPEGDEHDDQRWVVHDRIVHIDNPAALPCVVVVAGSDTTKEPTDA